MEMSSLNPLIEDYQCHLIKSSLLETETPYVQHESQITESFVQQQEESKQESTVDESQTSNIPPAYGLVYLHADYSLPDSTPVLRNTRNKLKNKPYLGLRYLSSRVMEKVQEKQANSFDEVATEIFKEIHDFNKDNPAFYKVQEDKMRGIKRRIYDILNVMVAIGMISKDKRNIKWIESTAPDVIEQQHLELQVKELRESIKQKKAELQQLVLQQVSYKNLLMLNKTKRDSQVNAQAARKKINLPFITVNTSKNSNIIHSTSNDKLEHVFDFERPFQIHDNVEVLMRMGMAFGLERNACSDQNLEISKTMVSKELVPYLVEMAKDGAITMSKERRKLQ